MKVIILIRKITILSGCAVWTMFINMWMHEWWHYFYATAVLGGHARIFYDGLTGYCISTVHDDLFFFIGGLGAGLTWLVVWVMMHEINAVLMEFIALMWSLEELLYGICEGLKIDPSIVILSIIMVVLLYGRRVIMWLLECDRT